MENDFEKKFNRRNFLSMTAKILAATATFGLFPDFAEAARKDKDKDKKKKSKKSKEFEMPPLVDFKTLDELEIGKVNLDFTSDMDVREGTGAVVIHHAGLSKDVDIDVPSIHDMHLGNGWAGIGYHFVVHKDGFIEQARPLKYVGAHAYQNNKYTVGICMTGNYNLAYPPFEQAFAVEQLTAALCKNYKIKPSDCTIFGHRDLNDTSCPGDKFYPYLPQLIKNVKKVL